MKYNMDCFVLLRETGGGGRTLWTESRRLIPGKETCEVLCNIRKFKWNTEVGK